MNAFDAIDVGDKRFKQGLTTMAARTVSPYGRYVNPRAAAGRRAGDSRQDYLGRCRIQVKFSSFGGTPVLSRLDVDVQKVSVWQS